MGKIKKYKPSPANTDIVKTATKDKTLKFSFFLFHGGDEELCPLVFNNGYVRKLMERLRDLSSWKVGKFMSDFDKSVRNHLIDWEKTSRPNGFPHLNEQYSAYPGWQFCITANAYGRVHGIIIEDTFYVIWLDAEHKLYTGNA